MSLIEEALRRAKDPTLKLSIQEISEQKGPHPVLVDEPVPIADPPGPSAKQRRLQSVAVSLCLMAAAGVMVATVVLAGAALFGRRAGEPVLNAGFQSDGRLIDLPNVRPPYVVSGVAQGAGPSFAVINGQILSVGETVNGATLMEIYENTVRLRTQSGKEIALAVPR